ncbi:MAG: DUF3352 domain-containing protein [Bacteroidales bacterium]|nr:DUF3352 domain-containing protein [Bacteroidales bacterium]MBN2820587.1 DUF3352 domain-containing protein [Bacteroidales bacterium]
MKRVLLILSLVIVLLIVTGIYFVRTSSGFRSIYFVPENSGLIIESKDPFAAWDKIIHSKAWEHYSKNEFFKEIDAEISSYDSLVNSSKILLKLIGKKSVMMAQIPTGKNEYDFVYIIDIGKLAGIKKPEKTIRTILGKNYELTTREYKNWKIIELLDKESSDFYFLSFAKGKLLFSFDPKMLEASLSASESMIIGRDIKFLDVKSEVSHKGLFSIYILHNNFSKFVASLSAEAKENYEMYAKGIAYSGLYFDMDADGLLRFESYSSFSEEITPNYLSVLQDGASNIESANIIPQRIASLAKINFDKGFDYFQNSMKMMGEENYLEYMSNLAQIQKRLKIDLEKNLFSWMDKEIVMLQTQPSNLGRSNEFAVILHAKDSANAVENLDFMWKQIKKSTPIKIKTVDYKGFRIDYIAFPGILKMLFGKAIRKIEKPYFSIINNNVVISNHPQTIKNIVDDYTNNETLANTENFEKFNAQFTRNTAALFYFEPPVLYHNLRDFVTTDTWLSLQKNKKYITCFSQAELQVKESDGMLNMVFLARYKPELEEWIKQFYNTSEITSLFSYVAPVPAIEAKAELEEKDTIPQIIISDFDAKKHEEHYENGQLKYQVELNDGIKHGNFKAFYENGELKIRGSFSDDEPTGKWKYYDEQGNLIKTDKY